MDETNNCKYKIQMKTPIGARFGYLTVLKHSDRISGHLEILKHSEPFEGTIDSEGNCEFIGKIVTLMQTICYAATGKITSDSLSLTLVSERNTFEITGNIC